MKRRLYRSTGERQLAGVCGGLAKCFGLDPTIVRLLFVFAALAVGPPAALIYLIMALMVPTDPRKISIVDDAAAA